MIEELYISKSFCCIGRNTKDCFGCAFCRVSQNNTEFEYSCVPSTINKNFTNLPVSVNLFYGDPLIQKEKTLEYLKELEMVNHKGPVVIITKGLLEHFDLPNDINLDLHLAFSTFGMWWKNDYDNFSHQNMERNINTFEKIINIINR